MCLLWLSLLLRGERGCDGSHSRANSEGLPGCVDVEQGNSTGRFGQVWKSVPHFSDSQSFNWDDIFIAADHVQPGTRRELDGPWISSKFLHFDF